MKVYFYNLLLNFCGFFNRVTVLSVCDSSLDFSNVFWFRVSKIYMSVRFCAWELFVLSYTYMRVFARLKQWKLKERIAIFVRFSHLHTRSHI